MKENQANYESNKNKNGLTMIQTHLTELKQIKCL